MYNKHPVLTVNVDPKTGFGRYTIGDSQITSNPTSDPNFPKGSYYTSFGKIIGPHTTGIFGPDGKIISSK